MSTSANPPTASAETASLRKAKLRAHIKSVLSTIPRHHTSLGGVSMRASRYVLRGWSWVAPAASNPLFT